MTVYIDVLIVINIYAAYFSVRATARLLHTDISFARTAAASVFGGVSALAALIPADIVISLPIKAALTVVIVLIAFGFGSVKLLAVRSFFCIAAGMLICGAAVMIHEFAGTDFIITANGYVYLDVSALVLVISSAVIYTLLTVMRRIFDSPCSDTKIKLTVTGANGVSAELTGISDSGNLLKDFLTGRPVIVCRREAVESIMPSGALAYISGSTDELSGIRLIPMTTAAGSTLVPAFRPERITAETGKTKKQLDALIAAVDGAFINEAFDALISDKLLR